MGIYLSNMEIPKTCHCCRMCVQVSDGDIDWHWECCLLCEKVTRYATDRIPDCPLVHVPPHGRLIDGDKLDAYLKTAAIMADGEAKEAYIDARAEARTMPVIIPAEEVE